MDKEEAAEAEEAEEEDYCWKAKQFIKVVLVDVCLSRNKNKKKN